MKKTIYQRMLAIRVFCVGFITALGRPYWLGFFVAFVALLLSWYLEPPRGWWPQHVTQEQR
jgi:hypothetical protein